jgi:predicted nuclease with RNAse H fold
MSLNTLILENGYKTIEVHPTSALRALGIPKTIGKGANKPERHGLERKP